MDSDEHRLDRLDIGDAATRLGLSVEAVRKRVQRGSLPAEKVDGRWFVVLPALDGPGRAGGAVQDTSGAVQDDGQDTTGQAIAALAAAFAKALDTERDRAGRAEQAAAMWQERARNLETENARLHAQLALPAPVSAPARPWWRRWGR